MDRRWQAAVLAALMSAAASFAPGAPAAADTLRIILDQAHILRLPDRVGTIVVGNPLIADVSVQANGVLVITGKGYGRTNLIVLDPAGSILKQAFVLVEGPRDSLLVYRGTDRESYSCAPRCERRITLGDAPAYFDATLAETTSRNGQAMGTAPASSAGTAH